MKALLILMAFGFYLCTSATAQLYIINTSWEDGNVVPNNARSETTTTYGQQISKDYARSGSHSCRFEVRDSDQKIGGGVRSELKTDMIFDQTQEDIAWVGYSIFYPNSMENTPQEEMVGQFPQTDVNGHWQPAMGFKNEGDFAIRAYVRQGDVKTIKNLTPFTFPKGQWVDFVWTVKFSLTGNGYIKCWCNGVQKLDYTGIVGYPGSKINFKWGIYPGWKTGPNGQSPRIVYWDNLKLMRNNGSYELVNPGGTTMQDQTITFGALPTKLATDADFNPGATVSSGLIVSYTSSNTSVATIVKGNIHIVGAGTSTITASQVGNSTYNTATNISQVLICGSTSMGVNDDIITAQNNWSSKYVSIENNKLAYPTDEKRNSIPDFSMVGYHSGSKKMPDIKVVKILFPPATGDAEELLQQAVNEVALLPIKHGFREAILLKSQKIND